MKLNPFFLLDEMGLAELRQELAESRNAIYQLRKNAEPYTRQRQEGWQGNRRRQDQQPTEQPGPKKGVTVPEGAAKGAKPPPSPPTKVQARMLRTSQRTRTSDSDGEMVYERANLVRVREDPQPEPMKEEKVQTSDHEEELPFDMDQIKTSDMTGEPDRERVNFERARLEPEAKLTKLSPIKPEPVKSEMVTNHITAAPNEKQIAEKKKAKRVKCALAIVEAGDYRVAMFGRLQANSARILWRADGSIIRRNGNKYVPEENEFDIFILPRPPRGAQQ